MLEGGLIDGIVIEVKSKQDEHAGKTRRGQ
jgi:hypothetical protein